jgi:hypothetical protein
MKVIAKGAFVVALLGMNALPVFASEAAVTEKVGPTYSLAMEGMT